MGDSGTADNKISAERIRAISAYIRTEHTARYGHLSPDDPIMLYVQEVFDEAMGAEAKDFKIIVFPGWREINAWALPDGTIGISAGLLEFVKHRDELKAVLAHEAMHIKRHHAEIAKWRKSHSHPASD